CRKKRACRSTRGPRRWLPPSGGSCLELEANAEPDTALAREVRPFRQVVGIDRRRTRIQRARRRQVVARGDDPAIAVAQIVRNAAAGAARNQVVSLIQLG